MSNLRSKDISILGVPYKHSIMVYSQQVKGGTHKGNNFMCYKRTPICIYHLLYNHKWFLPDGLVSRIYQTKKRNNLLSKSLKLSSSDQGQLTKI